jgi:hypothetical protein
MIGELCFSGNDKCERKNERSGIDLLIALKEKDEGADRKHKSQS